TTLLVFKYLGGLTFVFLNAGFAISGVWLLIGLRTGIWAPGFLFSIFILTFYFAVLYAISALIGVLTRSPIICILVTCAAWLVFWLVGLVQQHRNAPASASEARMRRAEALGKIEEAPMPPAGGPEATPWLKTSINVLHKVMPRTDDLGSLTTQFLSS